MTMVKSRWQSRVQDIRKEDRDPNIEDVRKLVRKIATEKKDPVFGRIMDGQSGKFPTKDENTRRSGQPVRSSAQQRISSFRLKKPRTVELEDTKAVSNAGSAKRTIRWNSVKISGGKDRIDFGV